MSSIFSRNSEADDSESLEIFREIFPRYYINGDAISVHNDVLPATERLKVNDLPNEISFF